MSKTSFIPLDNNINKLMAFTPSLIKDWRENQRIVTNPDQIETIEMVENLQKEGWYIKGSYQNKGNSGKVNKNVVKFVHPDLSVGNGKDVEGMANLLLTTHLNPETQINSDLGFYRVICENGMVGRESEFNFNFSANSSLEEYLESLNIGSSKLLGEIDSMNHVELSKIAQEQFAEEALKIRFNTNEQREINSNQLLSCSRPEDEGKQLWKVFNRVQENLTQPNKIFKNSGYPVNGVMNPLTDININQKLFQKAMALA